MARRLHLGVGKSNIRAGDASAAGSLGRTARAQFNEIQDNFQAFIDHLEQETPEALKEALEPTFEKSKVYCPKDKGDLVDSAYLEVVKFRNGARVEMGYAKGGNPDYAIFVHEMPYRHEAPTRSKFLETAVDEDYYNILTRVAQLIKFASGT